MDESFVSYHRVLAFAGVPIFAEQNWDSKYWLALQSFNFSIAILSFIGTSAFCILSIDDLPTFTEGACIWTTGVIMFISKTICLLFRNEFRSFIEQMCFVDTILEMPLIRIAMKQEGQEGALNELRIRVRDSQRKLLNLTKVLLKLYVTIVFVTAILYVGSALFQMAVREDKAQHILAFEIWLPWRLDNMYVYVASYIFDVYPAYLCCIMFPGFQSTVILLIGQTIRQLKVLTFIVKNVDRLAQDLKKLGIADTWQFCCTDILTQCAKHYIQLKSFNNRVNKICRFFYLTLILVAILLVCVCSVKIAMSNKLAPAVFKYYTHELCFVMMVFLFCFLGQQIQNECRVLETAIFEGFYIYDKKHKDHLKIFNMAVSQGMPIKIFGTITLSMPTFTWFLKTGMSFFTLMMSFLDGEQ